MEEIGIAIVDRMKIYGFLSQFLTPIILIFSLASLKYYLEN